MAFKNKSKTTFLEKLENGEIHLSITDSSTALQFLILLFKEIRPSAKRGHQDPNKNMDQMLWALDNTPALRVAFQLSLWFMLSETKLEPAIVESGIALQKGFWQEFADRIKHKFLPPLRATDDLLHPIHQIFYLKTDYEWVEAIEREKWIRFFEFFDWSEPITEKGFQQSLLQSQRILSIQVAQLGLEPEIRNFLDANATLQNPFVRLQHAWYELEQIYVSGEPLQLAMEQAIVIRSLLQECDKAIEHIRKWQEEQGTSIRQTYKLLLLSNRLERLYVLIDALDANHSFDTGRFVDLFRLIIKNENRKNSLRELMSQGFSYVAYRIAEHKGTKGHKYITSNRKEYFSMIVSSMWGGVIICFVAIIKNLLGFLHWVPFWQGFVYSVNYSLGFLLIEQTHSSLATKQPAFTASAIAGSLDARKKDANLYELAIIIARVSRSQFASFFGNLIIVFPGTFLLAWLYDFWMGEPIAKGEAAIKLLRDQHPWQSAALLYACFTGVFLFVSGIIAGYVQNKMLFAQIKERFIKHPRMHRYLKPEHIRTLAAFWEKNAGSIIGNVALGFFLGMAGIVVKVFGVPFDIRHITIAAGNVGIGLYGLSVGDISWTFLLEVIIGVLGIGFFNFLISFGLAFFVALKSRSIQLNNYTAFLGILGRYFLKYPANFIRPPKIQEAD